MPGLCAKAENGAKLLAVVSTPFVVVLFCVFKFLKRMTPFDKITQVGFWHS
jgi:hypothetical protein